MKRISAIVLLLMFCSVMAAGCNSSENSGTESINDYRDIPGITQEEISAIEQIKAEKGGFSFGHLLEPDSFMLPDGTFAGFTVNVCGLLSELFGTEFSPQYVEERDSLKSGLNNHSIDFTSGLPPAEVRGNTYIVSEPIAGHDLKILSSISSGEIKTEKDLQGMKIGFMSGTTHKVLFIEKYPDLSFEAVDVPSLDAAADMLETGEIDTFIMDGTADIHFLSYDFVRSWKLSHPAYIQISIATANPELAPFISVLNKYLAAGGADTMREMYSEGNSEYEKNKFLISLSEEESAYLRGLISENIPVNVALEHDNYPASFYNTQEKAFEGMAVDVINEVGRLTGIRFENITTEKTPWAEVLESLKTGKASIVTQLGYSEARKESFIWSEVPYSVNYYALISKMDYPPVNNYGITQLRVGTVAKSVYEDVYLEWFPDSRNLIGYDTFYECFDALENGEIDLVMGAEYILLMETNYREKTGYIINYRLDEPMESFFGFNKNETTLRSIVDKAQMQIDLAGIESYWSSRVFDYSTKISQMLTAFALIIAGALLAALVGVSFLLLKYNRVSKSLTERSATLSAIYASMPDSLFCKNAEGAYTSCNPVFERQAGLAESEIVGKTYAEVFKERVAGNVERYKNVDKAVLVEGKRETINETVIFPDGSQRLLETLKVPLIQDGRIAGLIGIGRDVTEHIEAQEQLEQIINTAQILFVLAIDGIIVKLNEYCKTQLGGKLGGDVRSFYPHIEDRELLLKKAESSGTASNITVSFKMANGEEHRFLSSVSITEYKHKKAYILWAIDIEQEEKKNDQIRATQNSLRSVLDALPIPIRIIDLESKEIVYVNDSLLELLEYEQAEDICKKKLNTLYPNTLGDGRTADEVADTIIGAEEFAAIELEYVTSTGRVIEAQVVTRIIDYKGRSSSLGIIKDLTAEKERARILLDAVEREKEANQTKSRFLANMSHEIRTPMNGIIGMTDLLMVEKLTPRQFEYVKDMKISAESMLGIINDILDLSKITEGKLRVTPVDIDLSVLLKNTVSMMRFSAESKQLEFIDDIQIDTPEYVKADDVRLKQVLVNILSNAIKFTKEGYVKLSAKIEGGNILFDISDTGAGIQKDDLSLIFEAFEQADMRKNRSIKGTGLGLSISKNLVELMGGTIWVESEYGVGTTFHFSIPYVQGNESAVETVDMAFEYISAPSAQILLVDDIQTNLTVGAGLLRLCGITADVALSGAEAIKLVKEKDYDIVFMDHMMPEMDGVEAMQAIKGMGGKFQKLPVIALTANAVNESRALLISSGMDDFLSKPIDKVELTNILKKWLPEGKISSGKNVADNGPSELSDILSRASEIKGLNVMLALDRISGMQDVLETSIKQVVFSVSERLKKMDGYLSAGDLPAFSIEAHGLKGALANIGATDKSELAAELEIASKAENMRICVNKFSTFSDVMESFANELRPIFTVERQTDRPAGDAAILRQKVDEAIGFLNDYEVIDALECLKELTEYSFGEETDGILNEAKIAAESFGYKKAITELSRLI